MPTNVSVMDAVKTVVVPVLLAQLALLGVLCLMQVPKLLRFIRERLAKRKTHRTIKKA